MDVIDRALKAQVELAEALGAAHSARKRRDAAVRAAHAKQIKPGYIAKVLGISAGRVTQIVSGAKDGS